MKKCLFTGSGVAIVTPFTQDGVDFQKLGELIEFQIKGKTDAIVICGTTGEASTMPDDEHISVIEYAVKQGLIVNIYLEDWSNGMRHSKDYVFYMMDELKAL
ncbi:MAG: hypothetical protein HGA22_08320, partial [Clostridiales bacterium]|nr:hypothetical protein [Clostridiales bacterium]